MADRAAYVAVDLGAESGRVIVGTLAAGRVDLEVVHRFANTPIHTPDGLHWDVARLYLEMLVGLRDAHGAYGDAIVGIGVDSWAVDYGLLDEAGRLLGLPYHYRDRRTDGVRDQVAIRVTPRKQFSRTGIAQLPFNTLYQLAAQRAAGDRTLDLAHSLLLIPDLLHYWLTGIKATERTNASTTGMLGVDGRWASDLIEPLDLPEHVLLPPANPGTILGALRREVRDECGMHAARVIIPATHDTASAVVAVPAGPRETGGVHAYISSGTWSLLGLELDQPVLTDEARLAGFTHESGVGGTYRFLTNIMGLWLLQECRRSWRRSGDAWSYQELVERAAARPSPGIVIDVDDLAFLHPDDMEAAIVDHLRKTEQPAPRDPASLTRAILEGLALAYRRGIEQAERITGTRVETVHVVGGGARNGLLCQLTADATRRPVVAGPVEATALGNVLVQAMGFGMVEDVAEARELARASTDLLTYQPRDVDGWDERAARLEVIRGTREPAPTGDPTGRV